MEAKTMSVDKKEKENLTVENDMEGKNEKQILGSADESGKTFTKEKGGEGRDASIEPTNTDIPISCKCRTKKLNRQEKVELGRKLQLALRSCDWELVEHMVVGVDVQTLNDALCMSVDSIWFLSTQEQLDGLTGLIKKIISNGACDFTRATMRTSFLSSCISACQGGGMSLSETEAFVAQRLNERLQECNGTEFSKKEASAKVLKFNEWAMKCIMIHQGNDNRRKLSSLVEVQLHLSAFKSFLDLVGNQLTIRDFTEAFDAACFPLTLFSCSFDTGWASGTSAYSIRGLLGMLAEGGADNVNQCILEAARFGSTEVVRMLLQIAGWHGLSVDVNLALSFAAYYSKFSTMECLVEEGHASGFLAPLMKAAERSCIPVIDWFVDRGCSDMELCLALTAAASSRQFDAATYLLPCIPHQALSGLSIQILKATAEKAGGSLDGVSFLLSSNFLRSPAATYQVAESIVMERSHGAVAPELREFLRENWSEAAFTKGVRKAEEHYLNVMRVLRKGRSAIQLNELPQGLVMAITLLPLYKECLKVRGQLLSQRLRGELVGVVRRLENQHVGEEIEGRELIAILERHLPSFLVRT